MQIRRKIKSIVASILVVTTFTLLFSPLFTKAGDSSMSRAEQEEATPQCKGPENPVGETLETAIAFTAKLDEILSRIIFDSKIIFKTSDDLAGVASGCDKKRCGDICKNILGSQCCKDCTTTDPVTGKIITYCCPGQTCNTLVEDCNSYCYPPPCGVGGMDKIDSDLSVVRGTLKEIKALRREYERTLVSYINIYDWAFGQAYYCNNLGVCVETSHLSPKNPKYLNSQCNNACVPAGKVSGYRCMDTAPPGSTLPNYECKASAKSYPGLSFSTLGDCQNVCGQVTWKCNTSLGRCESTLDGSGSYFDEDPCNNYCAVGMSALNISPMSECDPQWATTPLGSSTICDHGDSLTDVTMVANYCAGKKKYTPKDIGDKISGAVGSNGDINWGAVHCVCRGVGLEVNPYNMIKSGMNSWGYTDALTFIQEHYLENGIAIAVECDASLGSSQQDGYYSILLRGYDKNTKTVYYNDPKSGTEKTMTSSDYYNHCYSDKSSGKEGLIVGCYKP